MSRDDTELEGSCQEASFQPAAISSQRTCLRRCEKIAALPPAVRKGSAFSDPVAKKRKTIKSLGSVASRKAGGFPHNERQSGATHRWRSGRDFFRPSDGS